MRPFLHLAWLAVPTTLALSACRFSYELRERSDGSLGGAGAEPSDGESGGADASGGGSTAGGAAASGGAESGGAGSGGFSSSGGSASGGVPVVGGSGSGGASTGGGGASTGGGGSGGAASGGAGSGGSPAIDLPVTTTADEDDPGATVLDPGQTGLSLREALTLANDTPGLQTIGLGAGALLALDDVLPIITDGAVLLGQGASLDFSGAATASPCIHGDASSVSLRDMEITGCTGEPIFLADAAATGLEVLRTYVHDNGQAVTVYGTGSLIEDNRITGSGADGLALHGPAPVVRDNQILDSQSAGMYLSGATDGALLVGNLIARSDVGVSFGNLSGATLWFNTVDGASGFGLSIGVAAGIDLRNNIVTGCGTYGLNAADARFTVITHNLLFQNASGDCNSCTPSAPYLTSDPEYVDPAADDYALQLTSPAVDAGIEVGEDRNGTRAGNFDGSAPDLGHSEVD